MSENVIIAEGSVGRRVGNVSRLILDGVIVGVPSSGIGSVSTEIVGGVAYYTASVRATSSPSYGAQCGVVLDNETYVGLVDSNNVLNVRYPEDRSKELHISFSGSSATISSTDRFDFSRIQVYGNSGELIPFVPMSDRLSGIKYITGNGTFKASDVNLHSWSKVTVSVPGAPGEVPAGLEPETPLEDMTDEQVEDLADTDFTDPNEVTLTQPSVSPTDSALTGKDPDTGEHVVVKKDGNEVVTKVVPNVTMTIETPPDRIRYNEGEDIDFKGLVCQLSENGYVFVDEKHTDGHALSAELSYPQKKAMFMGSDDVDPDEAAELIEWTADSEYIVDEHKWICRLNERDFYKDTDGKAIVACVWGYRGGWNGPFLISTVREDAKSIVMTSTMEYVGWPSTEITYQGVTWYVNHKYHYVNGDMHYRDDMVAYEAHGATVEEVAAAMLELANVKVVGVPKTMVPVHWKSPYDGSLHIDSFEIIMGSDDDDTEAADLDIAPPLVDGGGGGIVDDSLPDDYYFNPTASGDLSGGSSWWGWSGEAAKKHLGG